MRDQNQIDMFQRSDFAGLRKFAEDMAKVLTVTATQRVPAGVFHQVVETYDTDPLNPDKREDKFFAPGVGPVHTIRVGGSHHEEIKLISFKRG